MVAIVRRVYDARSSPRVGCLVPHIKVLYEVQYANKNHLVDKKASAEDEKEE